MCEPPLGCFVVLEIQATKEHFVMLKKQLQPRDCGSNRQTKPSEADVFSGIFFYIQVSSGTLRNKPKIKMCTADKTL